MKNFLKENWFKLMTGTSMLVFSFAFLMYAVSPSFANASKESTIEDKPFNGANGVVHSEYAYFVDDGYVYKIWVNDLGDGGFRDIDNWRIAKIN